MFIVQKLCLAKTRRERPVLRRIVEITGYFLGNMTLLLGNIPHLTRLKIDVFYNDEMIKWLHILQAIRAGSTQLTSTQCPANQNQEPSFPEPSLPVPRA